MNTDLTSTSFGFKIGQHHNCGLQKCKKWNKKRELGIISRANCSSGISVHLIPFHSGDYGGRVQRASRFSWWSIRGTTASRFSRWSIRGTSVPNHKCGRCDPREPTESHIVVDAYIGAHNTIGRRFGIGAVRLNLRNYIFWSIAEPIAIITRTIN
jgi:hypothetical protein